MTGEGRGREMQVDGEGGERKGGGGGWRRKKLGERED